MVCNEVFRTSESLTQSVLRLSPKAKFLFIGSCFAENMSRKLNAGLADCFVNPYGVAYNPESVAMQLRRIVDRQSCPADEVICQNGLYHSLMAHSLIAAPTQQQLVATVDSLTAESHARLLEASLLGITLGTAWVYRLRQSGQTVANCHKLPSQSFDRVMLGVDEVADILTDILTDLWQVNPGLNVVITVSPVRHLKDTAHGNQLSKATLLLAVDKVLQRLADSRLSYFGAYELMMDDLRDYRFYADDMVHPSTIAVEYIWHRFASAYLAPETIEFLAEGAKITAALQHRPLNDLGTEYAKFLEATRSRAIRLAEKYSLDDDHPPLAAVLNDLDKRITDVLTKC